MKKFENQIIRGLKSGYESSYNQLFKEYYIVLSLFACRYVNNMETAKEIVQDFFVHLYEIRESIHIKSSLKSFLYQSVKNRCLNHIKHLQVREKHLANFKQDKETRADFEEKCIAAELEHEIYLVVKSMPEKCRKIFELSRINGDKNSEIAEKLGISKRTVETQISKALKILRVNLKSFLQLFF